MNKQHVSLTPKMKEDPVSENYIALFNAITDREITDINKEVDSRKYLKGLFDKEESKKKNKADRFNEKHRNENGSRAAYIS